MITTFNFNPKNEVTFKPRSEKWKDHIDVFLKISLGENGFGGTGNGELAIPLLWFEQKLFLTGNPYGGLG